MKEGDRPRYMGHDRHRRVPRDRNAAADVPGGKADEGAGLRPAAGALLPTAANRLPAAACYLRRPGDTRFRAFKLDVLRVRGGQIAETTTFGSSPFGAFGLPEVLPETGR